MHLLGILIGSLFGLVCGSNETSPICVNVFMKELDGDVTYTWISVNSSCPENYTNQRVRHNCEKFPVRRVIAEDVFLFTMVRGSESIDPYYNVYCAICNNETKFHYFSPFLTYHVDAVSQPANVLSLKDHDYTKLQVLRNLRMNPHTDEYEELTSIYDGIRYVFKMVRSLQVNRSKERDVPLHSFPYSNLRFCKNSKTSDDRTISDIETIDLSIDESNLNNPNHTRLLDLCKELSSMYQTRNYAANETAFCPEVTLPEFESCKYVDNASNLCSWNRFLVEGVDFIYGENGDIFSMKNHSRYGSHWYTNDTRMKNVIYFCNPKIEQENHHCIKILNNITSISRRISLFFVILYLFINSNHTYWSNLANRFAYSYYFTLLVMYIREEITEWWPDEENEMCLLKYYAYKYLSQSYSIWILICSSYVWYIIRFSKEEITTESRSGKGHLKIYLISCLFGWIVPAILSFIFYHLEPVHWCPSMEGYTSLRICQRYDYKNPFYWFTVIVLLTVSVTVVVLFADACYCYYFAKSIYNRYCKFNTLRARMVFLFKIVYSIGLYSMLATYSLLSLSESVYAILTHLWAFHGTVIFFVYSFKMAVLKQMFKDKDEVSENDFAKTPTKRKNVLIEVPEAQRNGVGIGND